MATDRLPEERVEHPEDWRTLQSLRGDDAVVVESAESTDRVWQESHERMADRLRSALADTE